MPRDKSSSHKPAHNLTCLQPEVSLLRLAKGNNAYLMHFSDLEGPSIIYTLNALQKESSIRLLSPPSGSGLDVNSITGRGGRKF